LEPTRILLVGLPRLLEEIVSEALAHESDLALAGVVRTPDELATEVVRTDADVVVLGRDDPRLIASVLEQRPRLAVFAVSEDARNSSLYALRPERVRMGDLSPGSFVAAVRAAAKPVATWWAR
jgi:chemotaxis response regulator CheB